MRSRALLIVTCRPEFEPSWTGQPHVTTLSLRRLGRPESDELVREIIGHDLALSNEIVEEIVERGDGVPLFLEELTKAVLETGAVGAILTTSATVPATLHASLMARLDRLGPVAKEIAQVAAAIGRDFSYQLLAAAAQRTSRIELGVGIVPDYVVHDDVQRGEVLTTLDAWRLSIFGTQMFMLYMPNRHHTRAMSTFIEFILDRAKNNQRQVAG